MDPRGDGIGVGKVGVFGKRFDSLGWGSGGGPRETFAWWLLSESGLEAFFAWRHWGEWRSASAFASG
jgi:hypothetical protein